MPGSVAVRLDIPAGPVLCLDQQMGQVAGEFQGLVGGPSATVEPGRQHVVLTSWLKCRPV
jgi:hypothetical protein